MKEYNSNSGPVVPVPALCYAWDIGLDRAAFLESSEAWGDRWGSFLHASGVQHGLWSELTQNGGCYGYAEACSAFFWSSVLGDSEFGMQRYERIIQAVTYAQTEDHDLFIEFIKNINTLHETQLDPAALRLDRRNGGDNFGRVFLDSQVGVYSYEELETYFQCLAEKLGAQPFELFLSNGTHVISVCFCAIKKEWLLFDINNEPGEPFNSRNLAVLSVKIMNKLNGNNGSVIFHTKIRCGLPYQNFLNRKIMALQKDPRWKKIHELDERRAQIKNKSDCSALLIAARNGNISAAHYLLDFGADVDAVSNNGLNALHLAAQKGHRDMVELLITHGANVHAVLEDNNTALHSAARNGYYEIVLLLISHGVDVNIALKGGHAALYLAAESGHVDIVRLLINHGAEIDAVSEESGNALLIAVQNGHFEVVCDLLAAGADSNSYFYSTAEELRKFAQNEDKDKNKENNFFGITERMEIFINNRMGKIKVYALDIARIMHGENAEIFKLLQRAQAVRSTPFWNQNGQYLDNLQAVPGPVKRARIDLEF